MADAAPSPEGHPPAAPEAVTVLALDDLLAPAPSGAAERVRPAREYDSPSSVLPGLPPGTVTHRLRGTETTQDG